jgi:antitoxin MazE
MPTTIAKWGNSYAVRIPARELKLAGLHNGDQVDVSVSSHGNLEISPASKTHRKVAPTPGISFASVFKGYDGQRFDSSNAWPSNELLGAEKDAWR